VNQTTKERRRTRLLSVITGVDRRLGRPSVDGTTDTVDCVTSGIEATYRHQGDTEGRECRQNRLSLFPSGLHRVGTETA